MHWNSEFTNKKTGICTSKLMKFPRVAMKLSILRSEWANPTYQTEVEVSFCRSVAGGDLEQGLAGRGACRRTWWGLGELLGGEVERVRAVLVLQVSAYIVCGSCFGRSLLLIPAPPAQALRLVSKYPTHIAQAFFSNFCFDAHSPQGCLLCSL